MKYLSGNRQLREWTEEEDRWIEEAIFLGQLPYDNSIYQKGALFLHKATGADYVSIGLMESEDKKLVRTLAFTFKQTVLDNLTYSTEQTPCEHVIGNNFIYFPGQLQDMFPQDLFLTQINVHCYMAVALNNAEDDTIGLISLLHQEELPQPALAEHLLFIMASLLEDNLTLQ